MYNNHKGFTLVEMLVVIVIIGILSAAVIPRVVGVAARARDVARKYDLTELSQSMKIYYLDHSGVYPAAFPSQNETQTTMNRRSLVASLNSSQSIDKKYLAQNITDHKGMGGSVDYISSFIQGYVGNIPSDPTGKGLKTQDKRGDCEPGSGYAYWTSDDQLSYAFTAQLETKKTGNTDNCGSSINQKQGDYYKIGEGLEYDDRVLTYDPEVDGDPKNRCIEHLESRPDIVDELRYSINKKSWSISTLCNQGTIVIVKDIDGKMPRGLNFLAKTSYLRFKASSELDIENAEVEGCFKSILLYGSKIKNLYINDASCLHGYEAFRLHGNLHIRSIDFGKKENHLSKPITIIIESNPNLISVSLPNIFHLTTLYVYWNKKLESLSLGNDVMMDILKFNVSSWNLSLGASGFNGCHILEFHGWSNKKLCPLNK